MENGRQKSRSSARFYQRWKKGRLRSHVTPADDAAHIATNRTLVVPVEIAPAHWSPVRHQIRMWLEQKSPPCAALYVTAVEILFGSPLPARVRVIAHCVREIRNALPYAVASDRLPLRGRFDYPTKTNLLVESWERAGLSLAGEVPQLGDESDRSAIPSSPDTPVQIPRRFFDQLGRFLTGHRRAFVSKRNAACRLFEACASAPQWDPLMYEPIVDRWLAVTDWFAERAHESGQPVVVTDDALRYQFEEFELYLSTFSRPFFDVLKEIDTIVEDANS